MLVWENKLQSQSKQNKNKNFLLNGLKYSKLTHILTL